jgi:hypothetical protein
LATNLYPGQKQEDWWAANNLDSFINLISSWKPGHHQDTWPAAGKLASGYEKNLVGS